MRSGRRRQRGKIAVKTKRVEGIVRRREEEEEEEEEEGKNRSPHQLDDSARGKTKVCP